MPPNNGALNSCNHQPHSYSTVPPTRYSKCSPQAFSCQTLERASLFPLRIIAPGPYSQAAKFASSRSSDPPDPQDVELARTWLQAFQSGVQSIPRQLGQISFSRSSGPGGQNVNKVNSKATLKVPLSALLPLVPRLLHPPLRASRFATERSQTLVIQSDESRQQSANVEACYEKLNQLLISSAKEMIPGETSQAQRDRVTKLQRAQNESRLQSKKFHSSKKSNRRGGKYDD